MLVLSRKESESVVFPSLGITVEVMKISGGKVRLGIQAPPDIPVHRQEVAERMERERVHPPVESHFADHDWVSVPVPG